MTIVTINYNDYDSTSTFINNIQDFKSIDHIVIVDNASTDDSLKRLILLENKKIKVLSSEVNGGYGYGNNLGINYAMKEYHEKYVIISNPDVIFNEEVITCLKEHLISYNNTAVASPVMLNKVGFRERNTAWNMPASGFKYLVANLPILHKFIRGFYLEVGNQPIYADAVAGSFLMVDVEKFMSAGGYDESFFLYCEEDVLGIRLKEKNYHSICCGDCEFIHNHSASINKTYPSMMQKQKMIWNSRKYLLKKYYHFNFFEMMLTNLLEKMSLFILSFRFVFL